MSLFGFVGFIRRGTYKAEDWVFFIINNGSILSVEITIRKHHYNTTW